MIKYLLISVWSLFLYTLTTKVQAQADCGSLKTDFSTRTVSQLELYKKNTEKERKAKGYRVQIHFGNTREAAKSVKDKFLSQVNQVNAYEIYQQPNFKIRVGDFRSHLDAYRFLKSIKSNFPNAYIVQDDINFPSLE